MSKEQAKVFFEALSQDKQLAEEVKEVLGGQATKQEKAEELLSLAKAHNFNFTEDELRMSLSIDDLADVAGGSGVGQAVVSSIMATTLGLGGTPAPLQLPIEQPAAIVQQVAGNAQNQEEHRDDSENEVPAANVDEEIDVVRAPTLGELRERLEREGQVQHNHELEEGIAQALHELNEDEIDRDGDPQHWFNLSRRVFSNVQGAEELVKRLERLERIYPRVRNYIITSRTDSSQHDVFDEGIKEWLRLICTPSKNVDISLQDLLAEADFFIAQATEATRSRLKAILPGIRHLSDRMSKAEIGSDLQQQIVDFCENAREIASAANVSFEKLQESLDAAYNLGDEATAIINSHFAPDPQPDTADEEKEVNEIRELTPEEIAERQQREEQERRELEERLAQGPLELTEPNWFEDEGTNRLFREIEDDDLIVRVNRLNTLYYRLLYAPQGQELMERIRNYIATVGFTFDRSTASLQAQISIADALIHEAEEMLQRAEQQRGEELREELREEIQHGLDTLALILQRMHTGLPGETDLYTDVQTYLANRESYTAQERSARAWELCDRFLEFNDWLDRFDGLGNGYRSAGLSNRYCFGNLGNSFRNMRFGPGGPHSFYEGYLEDDFLPVLATIGAILGVPGENELAFEIQKFFDTLGDNFTDEHLERLNELLDRAREMMMNRARAYTRFDMDQEHIGQNDLQLAQMLGIDGEYVREKIKNKIKMSANDITETIALPDGDTVTFNFMVGSGTLVLTGSGNTVIGNKYKTNSLFEQLEKSGIVFTVNGADGFWTGEQLPTRDYPFVVRNLIIGDGITEIGNSAFSQAIALRSVYFLGAVRSIGACAFEVFLRCHLHEVGFAQPEAVETIGKQAFSFHQKLVSINIPQNAAIDKSAFCLCNNLKKQGCQYCKE